MPQADPTFALSEAFWLFLTWGIVFLFLKIYAWPRITKRQNERQKEYQKWMDAAVQRQSDIAEWHQEYQQGLDTAHAQGRMNIYQKLAQFEKEAERKRQDFIAQHSTPPTIQTTDVTPIKIALSDWKQACLKILPFSSH